MDKNRRKKSQALRAKISRASDFSTIFTDLGSQFFNFHKLDSWKYSPRPLEIFLKIWVPHFINLLKIRGLSRFGKPKIRLEEFFSVTCLCCNFLGKPFWFRTHRKMLKFFKKSVFRVPMPMFAICLFLLLGDLLPIFWPNGPSFVLPAVQAGCLCSKG